MTVLDRSVQTFKTPVRVQEKKPKTIPNIREGYARNM